MPVNHLKGRNAKDRGLALALTLVFMAVLFIGASALATISINHLTSMKISSNQSIALQAAEAGLATVTRSIDANQNYGTTGLTVTGTVGTTSNWQVDFWNGSGTPAASQSVNNLANATTVTRSDGSVVPPQTADIIVQTNVQSPSQEIPKIGCMMQWNFNWASVVAAKGTFVASGDILTLEGASTMAIAKSLLPISLGGTASGTPDLPGVLSSNSPATPSVALEGTTYFPAKGFIMTPGTVVGLPPGVSVVPKTTTIPTVTWSFYSPNLAAPNVSNPASLPTSLGVSGPVDTYYHSGNVTLSSLSLTNCTLCVNGNLTVTGSLNLQQNSKIYVNGNMTVTGGVKDALGKSSCTGSIYCCGAANTLTVAGAALFDETNPTGVSYYSQGDISVTGNGLTQGLLYADGNINLNALATVVGIMISNTGSISITTMGGGATSGGARIIYVPVYKSKLATNSSLKKMSWRIIDK